jgi:D-aminoacyl-tRNA deacylase
MWMQEKPLLTLDTPDQTICSAIDDHQFPQFDDIVFLSRHAAASGIKSLTVHPIGIPWQSENSRSGGTPGRCSPPSFRTAALYRSMIAATKEKGIDQEYQVTLEATHHGPYTSLPTCFVEIGSSESEWSLKEAGEVWADVLCDHFCLQSQNIPEKMSQTNEIANANDVCESEPASSSLGGVVMLNVGGGHYVPKMNDIARYGDGLFLGHGLATYALQDFFAQASQESDGEHASSDGSFKQTWQGVLREAVETTLVTYPNSLVVVYIDKKAFNSEPRNKITSYLDELDVKWTFKAADIKDAWQQVMSGTYDPSNDPFTQKQVQAQGKGSGKKAGKQTNVKKPSVTKEPADVAAQTK